MGQVGTHCCAVYLNPAKLRRTGGQDTEGSLDGEAEGTPAFREAGAVLPARVTRSAVKRGAAQPVSAAPQANKDAKEAAAAPSKVGIEHCVLLELSGWPLVENISGAMLPWGTEDARLPACSEDAAAGLTVHGASGATLRCLTEDGRLEACAQDAEAPDFIIVRSIVTLTDTLRRRHRACPPRSRRSVQSCAAPPACTAPLPCREDGQLSRALELWCEAAVADRHMVAGRACFEVHSGPSSHA